MLVTRLARRAAVGSLGLALFLTSGCGGPKIRDVGPTPEQIEIQNLSTSVGMVRDALGAMAVERDRFQDLYLSANAELGQRKHDTEFLEANVRAQLQEMIKAQRELANANEQAAAAQAVATQNGEMLAHMREADDRLKKQMDVVNLERDELQRQLSEVRMESAKIAGEAGGVTAELEQARQRVHALEVAQKESEKSQREALQVRERDLARLRIEVERLGGDTSLSATAVAATGPGSDKPDSLATGTVGVVASGPPPSLSSYVVDLWDRCVKDVMNGHWTEDAMWLGGALVIVACLTLLTLIAQVRAARLKSKLRRLRFGSRGTPETVAPASAAPAAPTMRPMPVATMRPMPLTAAPSPQPAARSAPPALRVAPLHTAPSMNEELTQLMPQGDAGSEAGGDESWSAAVTENLDDVLRQSGMVRVQNRPAASAAQGAARRTSEAQDEDALLADLRQVISKKLKK
ncbi:MAG: hypothetical protein ACKVX7_03420 [Planctomycetota bacterium]